MLPRKRSSRGKGLFRRGFELALAVEHLLGLAVAEGLELLGERWIAIREHRDGKEAGIERSGLADVKGGPLALLHI